MRSKSKKELSTAYHEAGHAVMAVIEGVSFRYVTIIPERDTQGHIRYHSRGHNKFARGAERGTMRLDTAVRRLRTAMAGGVAEAMFTGRRNLVGQGLYRFRSPDGKLYYSSGHGDMMMISELVLYVCGPDHNEQRHFSNWVETGVRNSLQLNWDWLEVVASELIKESTLTEQQVFNLRCAVHGVDNVF